MTPIRPSLVLLTLVIGSACGSSGGGDSEPFPVVTTDGPGTAPGGTHSPSSPATGPTLAPPPTGMGGVPGEATGGAPAVSTPQGGAATEPFAGAGGTAPVSPTAPNEGGNGGESPVAGGSGGAPPGPPPFGGGGSGGHGGSSAPSGGAAGTAAAGANAGGSAGGETSPPGELPFFVGNITTRDAVDTGGLTFSDHWDQITPENAGKWGNVQSSPGSNFRWDTLDAIYDYALEHGLIFKEHAFVWGSQQPGGNIDENAVRTWMNEFCARYPETRIIDVVNEPPPHTTPSYVNAIGGGTNGNWAWVANSFKWAREACPDAILLLNDYNMIEWRNDANHIVSIVKAIQEQGAPIDALGAQAHDLDNGAVSFQTVQQLLELVHTETGLPMYITELDISTSNDQTQLNLYQQYFPFFRDSGIVKGITIWGWIYGQTWSYAPESGLIRNGASRPAMTWLMEELGRPAP